MAAIGAPAGIFRAAAPTLIAPKRPNHAVEEAGPEVAAPASATGQIQSGQPQPGQPAPGAAPLAATADAPAADSPAAGLPVVESPVAGLPGRTAGLHLLDPTLQIGSERRPGASPTRPANARPLEARTAEAAPAPRLLAAIPPTPTERGFRIVPLPRLAQGGRWRTEAMRSHAVPMLLWFTRGQGRITVAGVTRGFGAHNAVFLPPGTMHGFEMTAQVYGHAVFFPSGSAVEDELPEAPLHLRFRETAEQTELSQMIEAIGRELDRELPARDRALRHHAGLLAVWLERQAQAQQGDTLSPTAARRLSAAFAALVERDFPKGRTIADYAAELGVTPTHLTRSCNAACGRSAHDILSDRIFFEARRLLTETAMPVMEIAEALGFASPAYFTRAFQKAIGKTPTAFRAAPGAGGMRAAAAHH